MRKFTSISMNIFGCVMSLLSFQSVKAENLSGTYLMKALDFEQCAESVYGNTYCNDVEITIAKPTTQTNWDMVVTNLCGQGTVYGGTLSDNDSTLTLSNVAYAYFSDRDYTGKGTESLGSAAGTMMGDIIIRLNPDGTLSFSDFTVIRTILGDVPSFAVLASYKECVATPVKEYFFSCSENDFTTVTSKDAPSPHGIVYGSDWSFKVTPYTENENFDVEVSGLGGISSCKAYGTLAEDGSITLTMLSGAYLSAYEGYGGIGTESLGTAEGTILGGKMTLNLQEDGSYAVSDFTAVNTTITNGMLNSEIMASWKNGKATPMQKYHFSATAFSKGEDSPHGVVYPEEFDFTVRRCIETDNYDVVVTGLCGRETAKSYGEEDGNGNITLKMLSGTYLTPYEGYSGIGTESLGSADGAFMGSIVFTLQADGIYVIGDFTAINMVIDGMPLPTVLAKWEGGRGVPVGNTVAVGAPTAVIRVSTEAPVNMTVFDGSLVFGEEVECCVWRLDGTLVRSGRIHRVDGLDPGLYIVRINGASVTKVMVR